MSLALPVTALYVSLLAVLVVILALLVVRLRRGLKVGIGDGGNRDLARAIRVHGNAIESAPLFLILLAVYEINGGNASLLHVFGGAFFVSRVLHARGMLATAGASRGRVLGTIGTNTCLLGLAIANALRVLGV